MGNDSELNIVVRARNEAKKVLDDVRNQAGHATSTISKGFKNAVPASAALGVAIAGAGVAAIAFGKSSVEAYNGAIQAQTKLRTNLLNVKGATEAHVQSLLKQASALQAVGVIEDDVISAGMSQLATFNLQGKTIETLTPKITDMVAQLKGHNATAEDMVAINNLVGKVMTGNVGALSRYGVTLSETQKEQLKNGNEQERAALLAKVLGQNYGEVNKQLRNTPQGMITGLKNAFGDLQEGVGEFIVTALRPVILGFAGWVQSIEKAGGFMEYFKGLVKGNQTVVAMLAGAIGTALVPALVAAGVAMWTFVSPLIPFIAIGAAIGFLLKMMADRMGGWSELAKKAGEIAQMAFSGLKAVLDFLMPSLTALWNAIVTQLWPALQNLWNTIAPVLIPVLKTLAIIIGVTIVAAIFIAINVIKIIIQVVAWLANAFSVMFNVARTVFTGIMNVVMAVYNFVAPIFRAIFAVAKFQFQAIYLVIAVVVSMIMAVVRPIAGFIGGIFRSAYNIVTGIWRGISGFFGGIIGGIASKLSGVTHAITAPFSKAWDFVKDIPGKIVGAIGNIGQLLRDKLGDWDIPGPLGKVKDVIPGFASGGYTGRGGVNQVAGLVHKGEYVVPKRQVDQSTGMPMIGGGGVTNNFYGAITLDGDSAVDRFFQRLDSATDLARQGAPV